MELTPIPKPPLYKPGRSGIILALGILSVLTLGPLLGIPAWIMGSKDLRLIRAGAGPEDQRGITKGGMIAGIIGTFISPVNLILYGIIIAIVLSFSEATKIQSNKDAMTSDVSEIARLAYNYNGGKSYEGFRLPEKYTSNPNATYSVFPTDDGMQIIATSALCPTDKIIAVLSKQGSLGQWAYEGNFAP